MKNIKRNIIAIMAIAGVGTSISYASGFSKINLNIDGVDYEYSTRAPVVEDFFEKEDIELKDGDWINVAFKDDIHNDMNIIINTLKTVYLNGKEYKTTKTTVKDFFKENNLKLKKSGFKNFKDNDPLTDGLRLEYSLERARNSIEKDILKRREKIEYNPEVEYKKEKVIKGEDGIKEVTKLITFNSNNIVNEKIVNEKIIKKAIDDRKIIGSRETVTEDIQFNTEEKVDYNLNFGESYVEQEGVNGSKKIIYDHRPDSKEIISEEIIKPATNKIVVVGGKTQINTNAESVYSDAKEEIARRESGGSYTARNGRYIGRYQLDSAYLNGDHSPENQERVADNYVAGRYGSWEAALDFWNRNGWY